MRPAEKEKCPRIFISIFEKIVLEKEIETLTGDFEESYIRIVNEHGKIYAFFWCLLLMIRLLPSIIYNKIFWSSIMLKNYLKIAFRNMTRHRGFTFLNISGLALGITCFICIMMYVKYELSYDAFHEKEDRIFRVVQHWEGFNFRGSSELASTNGAMANVLPDEFPEIEYAVRVKIRTSSLKFNQNSVVEEGIYADKDFLNTFTFPLISGDPNTALQDPNTIVLTRELADKLFGNEDPIGKVIQGLRGHMLTVTGICENIPDNTHLQFSFIISFRTMYSERNDIDTEWNILNYYNYVLLKENVSYRELEQKLPLLVEKYHTPDSYNRYYYLQPVADIHLNTKIISRIANSGDKRYIYFFTAVAFLVLIIAGVNYVNLSTSRTPLRSKEVGIRKTVGALRSELIKQFLGESVILTVFALLVSMAIVVFVHPFFVNFVNQDIPLDILLNPANIAAIFSLVLILGIVSGFYPAFLLSSFRSANVLKSGTTQRRSGLRNTLVIFQFLVSIILIIGTIVIYKQLNFIGNKYIGFDKNNVININLWNSLNAERFEIIKEELVRHNNIISASISDRAPVRASENNSILVESENTGEMIRLPQVSHFYMDFDFIDTYRMRILEGRGLSKEIMTDRINAVVVNETLVKALDLKNPVGKRISASNIQDGRIVGVVEDFHFASFMNKIGPAVFVYRPQWAVRELSVKLSNGDIKSTLDFIQSTFLKHINDFVFNYSFLDDRINALYNSESRMGSIFLMFSVIAILIASFGLLGLVSSIAAQKTKEIGIRKVLGASISKIIGLMVKEFAVLIFISCLAALPISYFIMNKWLQNFAYRTSVSPWIMVLSTLTAFLIASLSVIYQVIKAARANPVNSLKHE
ncbi:ABC transporter permease [candidate division KSB1 bacterium]